MTTSCSIPGLNVPRSRFPDPEQDLPAAEGEQRVVDHVAVVAGDMRGGDDRIKNPQARVHDRRDGRFAILRRQ